MFFCVSVHLCVHLLPVLLGTCLLVFKKYLAQWYLVQIKKTGKNKIMFCLKMEKRPQNVFFFCIFWKILLLVFSWNILKWKIIFFYILQCNPLICQNCGSQVMDQIALGQSDYMTLQSAVTQEIMEGSSWFFACK